MSTKLKTTTKSILKESAVLTEVVQKPKESLPECSIEQKLIMDAIELGHNVSISSCPGSGKTTTILLLAQRFKDKNILQVTYNSQLKCEVREKAKLYGCDNLEIHSYHSLAVKYYDRNAHTDQVISNIVAHDLSLSCERVRFDIIVIDECQDKTQLYFSLICKFINDIYGVIQQPQVVLLGDRHQCIYRFKGADDRYLSLSNQIWNSIDRGEDDASVDVDSDVSVSTSAVASVTKHKPQMIDMSLSVSYRVTHEIAEFINQNVIGGGQRRLTAVKHGPKVEYVQCSPFRIHKYLAKKIIEGNYRPNDIFVLCPSVKSKTPCRALENELVSLGMPCYVPIDDNSKIDDSIIEGKVVFTTFHQSKGRERPLVIIYGFDNSYFQFFARDEDPNVCPSTLYVAISRASERLFLVADEKSEMMPFLKNMDIPSWHLKINTLAAGKTLNTGTNRGRVRGRAIEDVHKTTVTDLIKFIKDVYLLELSLIISDLYEKEYEVSTDAHIQNKVKTNASAGTNAGSEEVSELNGIAIPCIFQGQRHKYGKKDAKHILGGQDLYDFIISKKKTKFIQDALRIMKWPCQTIADYIYLANVYQSAASGMHFKLAQITNYDWLSPESVDICCQNMQHHLGDVKHYELPLGNNSDHNSPFYEFQSEYGMIRISGTVDAYEPGLIWEFKCVDSLQLEHFIQVAIYQWIWNSTRPDCPATTKLFNIRTGEIYRFNPIEGSETLLNTLIDILLKNKYQRECTTDDQTFINKCQQIMHKKKNDVVVANNEEDESDFAVSGGCLF